MTYKKKSNFTANSGSSRLHSICWQDAVWLGITTPIFYCTCHFEAFWETENYWYMFVENIVELWTRNKNTCMNKFLPYIIFPRCVLYYHNSPLIIDCFSYLKKGKLYKIFN